jgi:hypothetical protein
MRPFFDADPRMTDTGLGALAKAVAAELGDAHRGSAAHVTTAVAGITLPSKTLYQRQLACQGDLPLLQMQRYVTHKLPDQPDTTDAPIAVVGASVTGGDARNLSGYLSEALARPVTRDYAGETAHEAMAAYLTSDDFQRARPDLIVWFVPIWEAPTRFGDQPMRELLAAARDNCEPILNMTRGLDRLDADLTGFDTSGDRTLRLSSEGQIVTEARFDFASAAGRTLSRTVSRRDPDLATGRVYVPLSGLWSEGPDRVSVRLDSSLLSPSLAMCRDG